MARECSCGCGLRVGFTKGHISKRAARVRRLVEDMRLFEEPLRRGAEEGSESCRQGLDMLDEFCKEDDYYADRLTQVVHGEIAAQEVDHQQISRWENHTVKLRRGFGKMGITTKGLRNSAA